MCMFYSSEKQKTEQTNRNNKVPNNCSNRQKSIIYEYAAESVNTKNIKNR